ncbi:MAG: RNA polymerase sporulation sigma factor SigK [Bacillota bacterium]|nr:RNA polymerase sporulation sigma factor SigK [Bacillota bacterium]
MWGLVLSVLSTIAGYLSNSGTFPHPLKEEEEARYLQLMGEGNKAARDVLIERNLRLVAHVVKKFDNTGEDPDDLISTGTIGLIKGIRTFNPKYGTRLATYAARCIENEVLMFLRTKKRTRSEVFLSDPIGVDREGNEITLTDVLGTDPDIVPDTVHTIVQQKSVRTKLECLGRRERTVIELRYGLRSGVKRTQREIARLLGISRSYVSRIEKRAVYKLTQELGTKAASDS